jgi:hypothetical protein
MDNKVNRVPRGMSDLEVTSVSREIKVHPENKVYLVPPEYKETEVFRVFKVHKVSRETREIRVLKETLVNRAHKVLPVHLDQRVIVETKGDWSPRKQGRQG